MFTFTVLILLLGFDLVHAAVSNLQACDRADSRDAANVISTILQPRLKAQGYEIPDDCPLDTDRGLYSIQEAHKVLMRRNVWRCSWDKKTFRGEAYIDLHMENHHRNEIPDNPICLADLCGPLHCDFFKATSKGALKHLGTVPCHQGVMDEFRQRCQDIAHQCFGPVHGRAAEELHAFMLSSLCAAATCHWHRRKEILLPLASSHSGSQYLQALGLVAVGAVVLVTYAVIAAHWVHRSGNARNPVRRVLESAGFVKKRVTKLV